MHINNIQLIYGGGSTGIMGEIARTLVQLSGKDAVTGVSPLSLLGRERPDVPEQTEQYGRMTIVPDIQARKKLMLELVRDGGPGSGFVALSGGIGTMDEIMEMANLNQLGEHNRRSCLLNVNGYWDGILQWIEKAVEEGFAREGVRHILGSVTEAGEVAKWLRSCEEGRANE